jgi:Tol biopolymer transport system component
MLGAGGMGEVYRARDPRLKRDVALKVLPPEVASDAGRLRRFEQEARAAGALNHPNVLTVYDIGSQEGVSYIVSELLEGETLRGRLEEGALPIRKAVDYAVQIVHGLAEAHEKGIAHRDLKPENVFLTKTGRVKILDFGIAKLLELEPVGPEAVTATGKNEIFGTVGYMAPEQVKGLGADHRSDIFAFGTLFYEMLSRRQAFQRETGAETQAAILKEDPPDLSASNPSIPGALSRIVHRCLEKRPEERFQSARDLAFALEALSGSSEVASGLKGLTSEKASPGTRRRAGTRLAMAVVILAALGWAAWRALRTEPSLKNPLAGARFTRLTDWQGSALDAAISADGKFVAFLSDRDGLFDAWVTQVGSGEIRNLTKGQFPDLLNEEIRNIGFSDDDTHVWIRVTRKSPFGALRKMDVWLIPTMGGVARPFLAEGTTVAWSPDRSQIVYHTPAPGDPIYVADRNGGNPKQLFVEKPGVHNHYPTWSPDGRFVYWVRGIPTIYDMDIWRILSTGGEPERLTNHDALVAYPALLDSDTLIYTATSEAGSGLYAMDLHGRVAHRVSFGLEEYISIAAGRDGRRLVATVANPTRNLWTVPILDHVVSESEAARFDLPVVRAAAPRFGPDYLLFLSSKGTSYGLWKLKDGSAVELWRGSEGTVVAAPAISSDGARIAFPVRKEGRSRLFLMSADGLNAHSMMESLDVREVASWSPDGKWIAVSANEGQANPLLKVPADGGPPVRLVEGVTYDPVWSPDGRLIVYSESHGGGSYQVKAVSPDGQPYSLPELWVRFAGNRYRFLPDGKALVLTLGQVRQQNFWLLDLATRRLRQLTDLRRGFDTKSFDISPDGKQILFDRFRENSDIVLIDRNPR